MTVISLLAFSLLNILIIDLLVRLSVRHTQETRNFKTAGIVALFILATIYKGVKFLDQSIAIRRYALTVLFIVLNSLILYALFDHDAMQKLPTFAILLCLLPILAMPLYHLLFGILGNNPLALMGSVENFRQRGTVALILGANVVFAALNENNNLWILLIETIAAFLALVHTFYLLTRTRSKISFFTIDREDSDAGPVAFFYYLLSILEYYFYCTVLYLAIFGKALGMLSPNLEVCLIYISLFGLYVLAFITAKVLIISRNVIGPNFYERGILPLSFLFFGMTLITEHSW